MSKNGNMGINKYSPGESLSRWPLEIQAVSGCLSRGKMTPNWYQDKLQSLMKQGRVPFIKNKTQMQGNKAQNVGLSTRPGNTQLYY